jgi:hypothetical protein
MIGHGYKVALQDKIKQAEGIVHGVIDLALSSKAAHEVAVPLLQRLMALGMDLVNLVLNQHHELVMKGKIDVDKALELTAKMIHAFWAEVYKVHTPNTQACLPATIKGCSKDMAKVL